MGPKAVKRKATGTDDKSAADMVSLPGPASGAGLPPAKIDSFRGEYNFLSNFFHSPIIQEDLEFSTVEHAFQAAKCLDRENKLLILNCKSPTIAKRAGRKVPLRPDWESVKFDIMHDILALKFAPGSHLGKLLLATGDAELIEGNMWHDNVWGSCMCAKHKSTPGQNILGKLISQVREELRLNEKPSTGNIPCSS